LNYSPTNSLYSLTNLAENTTEGKPITWGYQLSPPDGLLRYGYLPAII